MINSGKLLLSSGLVVASGAYAWWQQQSAPLPPLPVPKPVAVEASKPAPAAMAPAPPVVAEPAPTPAPMAKAPSPQAPPAKKLARAEPAPVTAPATLLPATPAPQAAPAAPAPPADPLNAVVLAPPPASSTGRYADGEFVGNAADGEWGPVQVKAVVKNGDIADVICIEYPYHRQRSAEISEWAIPQLIEESIKAQSEKIDWVSQASFTSDQFQKSLASALVRAKKPL